MRRRTAATLGSASIATTLCEVSCPISHVGVVRLLYVEVVRISSPKVAPPLVAVCVICEVMLPYASMPPLGIAVERTTAVDGGTQNLTAGFTSDGSASSRQFDPHR